MRVSDWLVILFGCAGAIALAAVVSTFATPKIAVRLLGRRRRAVTGLLIICSILIAIVGLILSAMSTHGAVTLPAPSDVWDGLIGAVVGGSLAAWASTKTARAALNHEARQAEDDRADARTRAADDRLQDAIEAALLASGDMITFFTAPEPPPDGEAKFRAWETRHFVLVTRFDERHLQCFAVFRTILYSSRAFMRKGDRHQASLDALAYQGALAALARGDADLLNGTTTAETYLAFVREDS